MSDSPRDLAFSHHSTQLANLGGPYRARRPDGNIVELPATVPLKPGWVRIREDGTDVDEPDELRQRRAYIPGANESNGPISPRPRYTGRIVDGEREIVDDRDFFRRVPDDGDERSASEMIAADHSLFPQPIERK